MLSASPVYLALVALLFIFLSARVILARRRAQAAYGDGGDLELRKRIRAHANCAEYAPLLLLLLVAAELQGTPGWVIHLFGALIVLSRALHAYWISQSPEPVQRRVLTMGTTFTLMALLALGNLAHAIL
ncbi:MAG: MAPEG family protein [Paracoccaceae bacterium]